MQEVQSSENGQGPSAGALGPAVAGSAGARRGIVRRGRVLLRVARGRAVVATAVAPRPIESV